MSTARALIMLCTAVVTINGLTLTSKKVIKAIHAKFPDKAKVSRVVECFEAFSKGDEIDTFLADGSHQTANCFVKGLTARSFHAVDNFPWAKGLEQGAKIVQEELADFLVRTRGDSSTDDVWLGPRFVQADFGHYGKDWKTIGIQDRGLWDEDNVKMFPKTVALLEACKVPCQEVFFARQGPKSGIKAHSDLNNFILTAHLAVDVPQGHCYIQVGQEKHYWENGKVCVFDTSVFHSTQNDADADRYVLIMRFWHPELTQIETQAFEYLFDCLDTME